MNQSHSFEARDQAMVAEQPAQSQWKFPDQLSVSSFP